MRKSDELPTLYVNTAESHSGGPVVYLTLGLLAPTPFTPESAQKGQAATPVFCGVMTRSTARFLVEVLSAHLDEEAP